MIQAQIGRDEILARATSLVPDLRARSEQSEKLRRCPDETIGQYQELGLLKICQPKRYGGYELGWDVLCEVSQTLARACGSQAWVQNVYADHAQKVGTFSPEAQDDVWGENPNARISASFDPIGKARRVSHDKRVAPLPLPLPAPCAVDGHVIGRPLSAAAIPGDQQIAVGAFDDSRRVVVIRAKRENQIVLVERNRLSRPAHAGKESRQEDTPQEKSDADAANWFGHAR